MATYASLSAEDKAVVDNISTILRGCAGEMARIWNKIKAIADDSNAVNLMQSVDAGDTIPNKSGLAGADDMTRTELQAVYTLLNGIRTANDTTPNRNSMSKAAGINAMLGM